jgi:hypothetical protein
MSLLLLVLIPFTESMLLRGAPQLQIAVNPMTTPDAPSVSDITSGEGVDLVSEDDLNNSVNVSVDQPITPIDSNSPADLFEKFTVNIQPPPIPSASDFLASATLPNVVALPDSVSEFTEIMKPFNAMSFNNS